MQFALLQLSQQNVQKKAGWMLFFQIANASDLHELALRQNAYSIR